MTWVFMPLDHGHIHIPLQSIKYDLQHGRKNMLIGIILT